MGSENASPSLWSQFASFITTPTGILVTGLVVAILASLWWAASNWYDAHALGVDVTETGAPVGYAAYRRREKRRKTKK